MNKRGLEAENLFLDDVSKRGKNQRFLRCNFFPKNSNGQLTIFIIVGVLMFVGVALFFLFRTQVQTKLSGGLSESNMNLFMESCLEDSVRAAAKEISLEGGLTGERLNLNFKFTGDDKYYNISYLCYTPINYAPCVNQAPNLQKNIEDEIKANISGDVQNCFNQLKAGLQNSGYGVSVDYRGFDVKLETKKIAVETQSAVKLSKTGKSSTQENMKFEINSRLYEIAGVVGEIVNQEARFCNFDMNSFMLTYPEFDVRGFGLQERGLIYTVQHKETEEKFRFAVRSCNTPSGVLNQ